MTKFYTHRILKKWLKEHKKYFKYPPRIVKETGKYIEMRFHDLHPRLAFFLQKNCDSVLVFTGSRGEWIDILYDLDRVYPEKTARGTYFCSHCFANNVHREFPTLEALHISHIFEPLLRWINALDESKYFIIQQDEGWSAVFVEDPESIARKKLEKYPRVKAVRGKTAFI